MSVSSGGEDGPSFDEPGEMSEAEKKEWEQHNAEKLIEQRAAVLKVDSEN